MRIFAGFAAAWLRRLVRVAPLAFAVAVADWALKIGAVSSNQRISFHWFYDRQHPWLMVVVAILFVGAISAVAQTRLAMVGLGLVLGGLVGNFGELAAFGHVTDFIPFPPGSLSAPADFFMLLGWLVFSTGYWGDRLRRTRVSAS